MNKANLHYILKAPITDVVHFEFLKDNTRITLLVMAKFLLQVNKKCDKAGNKVMGPIWYMLKSANTSPAQTSMHWQPHSKMEVCEVKHWCEKISIFSGRNA
jgi:hypothetical protein